MYDQVCTSTTSCWHQPWQDATILSPPSYVAAAATLSSSSATSSVIDTTSNGEVKRARAAPPAALRDKDSFRTAMFLSCWTCS
ncbi:hypothetical protein SOVF_171240 [Spinacia oleracea]|nr:hypothetical protein SOVF_171240 [Spinacia oleracea]